MHLSDFKSINIGGIDMKEIYLNGRLLWSIPTGRLPNAYQEVEWIQAGANIGAYIDLGFSFDTSARVRLGMYKIGTSSSYIFGAAENSGKYRCMISAPYEEVEAYAYGFDGSDYASIKTGIDDGYNDLEYTLKPGTLSLKNITHGNSYTDSSNAAFTMTSNLFLFAQNYNGTARYGVFRKISYFQYYDKTDTLICDLIPCYRKSDGTVGMYDVVRKMFLTNLGDGTFIKGPNVGRYTNLVPFSTIEDGGTIYNDGLGYKYGYRVRSGGAEEAASGAMCTGFIPFTKNDRLYIYPPFIGENATNAINFADKTFTNIGQVCDSGAVYGICAGHFAEFGTQVINGASVLDLSESTVSGVEDIAYVRITHTLSVANSENFIITKNEEKTQDDTDIEFITIPSEYQKVEWIQADANVGAYIDLGFSYNMGAKICLGQWIMNDNIAYPFGAAENSGKLRCMFSSPYSSSVTVYSVTASGYTSAMVKYVKNVLNELSATYREGYLELLNLTSAHVSTNKSIISYTMTNNLYLFAQNYNGSPRFGDIRRISYFKYYNKDGVLVCNLVPCYRRSDGVIGMYDVVRNIFLTNVGTGSFTKGPDAGNRAYPLPNNTTDTTKWVNGYRFSATGISAQSGTTLSNDIRPCTGGDVIRIKGVTLREENDRIAIHYVGGDTNSYVVGYFNRGITSGTSTPVVYNGLIDGAYTFTLSNWGNYVIDGFRFAMPTPTDPSSVIITVNEEIV